MCYIVHRTLKPDFEKKEYETWKPLAMQAVSLRRKEGEILKTEKDTVAVRVQENLHFFDSFQSRMSGLAMT